MTNPESPAPIYYGTYQCSSELYSTPQRGHQVVKQTIRPQIPQHSRCQKYIVIRSSNQVLGRQLNMVFIYIYEHQENCKIAKLQNYVCNLAVAALF